MTKPTPNLANKAKEIHKKTVIIYRNNKQTVNALLIVILIVLFVGLFIIGAKAYSRYLKKSILFIDKKFPIAQAKHSLQNSDYQKVSSNVNYSWSFWLYVKNWKETESKKIIFYKHTTMLQKGDTPDLMFYLDYNSNDLFFQQVLQDDTHFQCKASNIPIQRWFHVGCVIRTTDVDLYINGRLVNHCVASIPFKLTNKNQTSLYLGSPSNDYLSQMVISQLNYRRDVLNRIQMNRIFNRGPSGDFWFTKYPPLSWFAWLFDKFVGGVGHAITSSIDNNQQRELEKQQILQSCST